jgi:hypothetical protein
LAERRLAIAALFQLLDDIVGTAQRSASVRKHYLSAILSALHSAWVAASNQVCAICKNVSRS